MQRAAGSVRRDDSPSGGDLGQLSERTTQLLMRFGTPLCHDLYGDNGTCANPPADLGGTLRYSPATWQRYRGVMMTFHQRSAWIVPTVRGCDKYDGHLISFHYRIATHDLYAVISQIADMVIRKVRYHALAVSAASVFM